MASEEVSDGPSGRGNGFDGLRLAAAALVIVGHAYPLTGNVAPGLLANGIQTIAVKTFFVISGMLITGSWMADPNIVRYAMRRALRIFPGLILLCVFTIFVVGPVFTRVSLDSYIVNIATWLYAWNVALYPMYFLPGVFEQNIYPAAINGSLWSLPVEVAMYVGVAVIAVLLPGARRVAIPVVAIVLLWLSIYFVRLHQPATPIVIWGTSMTSLLDAAYYFFAGSTICVLGLQRFSNWWLSVLLFVAAAVTINGVVSGELVLAIILPYAVMSIGKLHVRVLRRLDGNDYSYGLYLYGFLVQQALVARFQQTSPTLNAAIALPIALGLGVISWHVIEKRALMLKPRRRPRTAQLVGTA